MIEEIWKDIEGYNGTYQISNLGNVRRYSKVSARIIRGYDYADLHYKNKRKNCSIHRLVAKAFVSNLENKPEVNHIDGNKLNNSFTNLEWVTSSENNKHAYKHKLKIPKRGELSGRHLVTEKQVKEIRSLFSKGTSRRDLAIKFNLGYSTVVHIILGTRWNHSI